jgi:hypothetical protein
LEAKVPIDCAASTRSEQPVREGSRKVSWIRTLVQLVVLSVLPQVLGTLLAGPVLASDAQLYCLPGCRLDAAGPTRAGPEHGTAETLAPLAPPWCLAWTNGATTCERNGDQTSCRAGGISATDTAALNGVLPEPFARSMALGKQEAKLQWWQQHLAPVTESPLWTCTTQSMAGRVETKCSTPPEAQINDQATFPFYCYRLAVTTDRRPEPTNYCSPGCFFKKRKPWFYAVLSEDNKQHIYSPPPWCAGWTDGCGGCAEGPPYGLGDLFGIPRGNMCRSMECRNFEPNDYRFCINVRNASW